MNKEWSVGWIAGIVLAITTLVAQEDSRREKEPRGGGEMRMPTPAFQTTVPEQIMDCVAGRPTQRAVTLSLLFYREPVEACVVYEPISGGGELRTERMRYGKGEPTELSLEGLKPDTAYRYGVEWRRLGEEAWTGGWKGRFRTARPRGSSFVFTVQADSHLDYGTDTEVYLGSITNVHASSPDFHIDLGDTFMTDKYTDFRLAGDQYLAQRYYFGMASRVAPVFLVLGNHDGEQPAKGGAGVDRMAVWANSMRKRYFPNPTPNEFYSGNEQRHAQLGLLQNYYSWEWGDALFVVLDPYWYSLRARRDEGGNWSRTLGVEQYRWLVRVLESSSARFRFVFIHNLVGGETPEGRGGAEASRFFEWGGRELDGRETFRERRPTWELPIHDILKKHRVNVVYHGHDHLYVQQERDGVIYQEVPQPGHVRSDNTRSAAEYGYRSGVIQGSSGILRVTVTSTSVVSEYVRAYGARARRAGAVDGTVSHRYVIP